MSEARCLFNTKVNILFVLFVLSVSLLEMCYLCADSRYVNQDFQSKSQVKLLFPHKGYIRLTCFSAVNKEKRQDISTCLVMVLTDLFNLFQKSEK